MTGPRTSRLGIRGRLEVDAEAGDGGLEEPLAEQVEEAVGGRLAAEHEALGQRGRLHELRVALQVRLVELVRRQRLDVRRHLHRDRRLRLPRTSSSSSRSRSRRSTSGAGERVRAVRALRHWRGA